MGLRVTIDVFSGRPNPVVDLGAGDAQDLIERLQPARRLEPGEPDLPAQPTLGYRGVVIEQTGRERAGGLPTSFRLVGGDLFGRGLAHRARDEAVEDFICGSTGPFRRDLEPHFFEWLRVEIDRFAEIRRKFPIEFVAWPWPTACGCAPLYEPSWWNVPSRQPFNNCYNYAADHRTDTFHVTGGGGQPGAAAGAMYTALACGAVRAAAVADKLIDSPGADNRCPGEGHLVALVVAPNQDFHWYRKGRNGSWSHKPGPTAVTNVDNSGAAIPDPRTADRGPYHDFCTFMVVMHGHIKIA